MEFFSFIWISILEHFPPKMSDLTHFFFLVEIRVKVKNFLRIGYLYVIRNMQIEKSVIVKFESTYLK